MNEPTAVPRWVIPAAIRPPVWVPLLGYTAAIVLGAVFVAAASAGTDPDQISDAARLVGQVGFWAGLIATVLVASRVWGTGAIATDLAVSATGRDWIVGGLAGIGTQAALLPLLYWAIELFTGPLDVDGPANELLDGGGAAYLVIVVISAVVVAPLVEELFFRGVLLASLGRRLSPLIAGVVGSLLFAGTHFQLVQLPGLFVAGLVFSLLALRAGRLGPAIAAHVAFNATTVAYHLIWQA